MSKEESMRLIEDIITCVNVYNYSRLNNLEKKPKWHEDSRNNIFLKAYGELTTYLRYLLIYYNSKVGDESLKSVDIPFISFLKKSIDKYDELVIVSYNYDIWLERLLSLHDLEFNIEGFETKQTKIRILKPHGSISFSFKVKVNGDFTIRESEFDYTQEVDHFDIKYDLTNDYPLVNAIIPPAGDPNRTDMSWIKCLRQSVNERIKSASSGDQLVIFGLSYWPVDRNEIDEILTQIHPDVDVKLVNPNPPTNLDAVLTSLFNNYVHFVNSELLEVSI